MDIVERLRNSDDLSDQQITFACAEAADEIERLRADLAAVDSMVAAMRNAIDSKPREEWPEGSVLEAAIARHEARSRHEQYAREG